jgi:hypothetical protein
VTGIALALERRVEDRIVGDLIARGHDIVARVQTAGELQAVLERSELEVVLVSGSRSRLTSALVAQCDDRGVRLIVLAAGELERRHAAQLGVYDVLDFTADWGEIEAMLVAPAAISLRASERQTRSAPGEVVAVWGPAGAPGRTTVATTLAAELAAAGRTVVLADVDTYGGAIAPALGLLDEAPGFAAACRLAGAESLTHAEFTRIAQRYTSPRGSFWVLTGLGRPARWPELTPDRVTRALESCTLWADHVIVDVGFSLESDEEVSSDLFAPRRNGATLAALRAAQRIVAVGLADPVGLSRLLRVYPELNEIAPQIRPDLLINRVRSSVVGLNPKGQLTATLARFGGVAPAVLIPDDPSGCDAAILGACTLGEAAPKSPALAALRAFATGSLAPEIGELRVRRRRRATRAAATA